MSSGCGRPVLIGEGSVVQECSVDHVGQPSFEGSDGLFRGVSGVFAALQKGAGAGCQWACVRAIRWIAQLS
jgi:hypothetical protein